MNNSTTVEHQYNEPLLVYNEDRGITNDIFQISLVVSQ